MWTATGAAGGCSTQRQPVRGSPRTRAHVRQLRSRGMKCAWTTLLVWLSVLGLGAAELARDVALAGSPIEFRTALHAGVEHVVVTNHLDLTILQPKQVEILDRTATIRGNCSDKPPPQHLLEPMLSNEQCVLHAAGGFVSISAASAAVWISDVYVVLSQANCDCQEPPVRMLHIMQGDVFLINVVLVGNGNGSQSISAVGDTRVYARDCSFTNALRGAPAVQLGSSASATFHDVHFRLMPALPAAVGSAGDSPDPAMRLACFADNGAWLWLIASQVTRPSSQPNLQTWDVAVATGGCQVFSSRSVVTLFNEASGREEDPWGLDMGSVGADDQDDWHSHVAPSMAEPDSAKSLGAPSKAERRARLLTERNSWFQATVQDQAIATGLPPYYVHLSPDPGMLRIVSPQAQSAPPPPLGHVPAWVTIVSVIGAIMVAMLTAVVLLRCCIVHQARMRWHGVKEIPFQELQASSKVATSADVTTPHSSTIRRPDEVHGRTPSDAAHSAQLSASSEEMMLSQPPSSYSGMASADVSASAPKPPPTQPPSSGSLPGWEWASSADSRTAVSSTTWDNVSISHRNLDLVGLSQVGPDGERHLGLSNSPVVASAPAPVPHTEANTLARLSEEQLVRAQEASPLADGGQTSLTSARGEVSSLMSHTTTQTLPAVQETRLERNTVHDNPMHDSDTLEFVKAAGLDGCHESDWSRSYTSSTAMPHSHLRPRGVAAASLASSTQDGGGAGSVSQRSPLRAASAAWGMHSPASTAGSVSRAGSTIRGSGSPYAHMHTDATVYGRVPELSLSVDACVHPLYTGADEAPVFTAAPEAVDVQTHTTRRTTQGMPALTDTNRTLVPPRPPVIPPPPPQARPPLMPPPGVAYFQQNVQELAPDSGASIVQTGSITLHSVPSSSLMGPLSEATSLSLAGGTPATAGRTSPDILTTAQFEHSSGNDWTADGSPGPPPSAGFQRTTKHPDAPDEPSTTTIERVRSQLSQMHEQSTLFRGVFLVLSPDEMRISRAGVVQFAWSPYEPVTTHPTADGFALKFFTSVAEYDRTTALFSNPVTRDLMPAIIDCVPHGCGLGPSGKALPPCVISRRGATLDEWLSSGRMNMVDVLSMLRCLASLLRGLHDRGLVYNALKGSNVAWYKDRGQWRLIDFGSTTLVGSRATVHIDLRLASPELVLASLDENSVVAMNPASDMWALGVLAYETITGMPIFPSTMAPQDMCTQLLGKVSLPWEAGSLTGLLGQYPGILLACLARDPEMRPTATDVVNALPDVEAD